MTAGLLHRDLGDLLTRWRIRAGYSSREAAAYEFGTTKDILGSYETGRLQYMEPMTVGWLLRKYGAPEYVVSEAESKAKQIRLGSPNTWRDNGPKWFERLKQLEPLATSIDIFEDSYITGLLQTRAYGHALMEAGGQMTLKQIDASLDLRESRREGVLDRQNPAKMRVIQAQSSLDLMQGTEFYEEQLQRLREDNRRTQVEIYILSTRHFHPSMIGSYTILGFDDDERDVGYHEGPFGAHYEATKKETDRVRDVFSDTLAMAERLT
ncbi:Helix-turn-helix domain-containing protein [Glycomyces sambucus]|uniref:Helix-turn-helix domain-containing protein n=1 Tax=Glycomyces sambucus TaxID=380244 RepID=A0A1G9D7R7_9ACTN|nr:helix-turn-helix transcriptional regulator [Glycomyces sambucus]SDK59745.1 Helix-turn-helix domain-containing protein [Glycomyces sambucus]